MKRFPKFLQLFVLHSNSGCGRRGWGGEGGGAWTQRRLHWACRVNKFSSRCVCFSQGVNNWIVASLCLTESASLSWCICTLASVQATICSLNFVPCYWSSVFGHPVLTVVQYQQCVECSPLSNELQVCAIFMCWKKFSDLLQVYEATLTLCVCVRVREREFVMYGLVKVAHFIDGTPDKVHPSLRLFWGNINPSQITTTYMTIAFCWVSMWSLLWSLARLFTAAACISAV